MTIEEAIKLLHPDTTGEGIMELQYYGGFEAKEKVIKAIEEACILACEALEKQIPKKVNVQKWIDTKYCKNCGQRLDWGVEE